MFKATYSNYRKPPISSEVNWGHPLSKSLDTCFLFNEKKGSYINDIVTKRVGTLTGCDWVGDGLEFNGSTDFVLGNNLLLRAPFTVIVSFYGYTVAEQAIFSVGNTTGAADKVFHMVQTPNSNDGVMRFAHWADDWDNTLPITTLIGLHFQAAYTELPNKVRGMFINGQSYGNNTAGAVFSGGQTYNIGRNVGNSGSNWAGRISYIYVYNRVLNQSEIYSLYREPYSFIVPK